MTNNKDYYNTPIGSHVPSQDYNNINTNFSSISFLMNVDLYGFEQDSGGFHQKSTYVDQSANPGSVALQYVVYSKQSSSPTQSELFAQKDATATPIQLTRGVPAVQSSNVACISYLPGGFYIGFASVAIAATNATITFPAGVTITNFSSITATSDQPVALYVSARSTGATPSVTISRVSGSGAVGCFVTVIGN